MIAYSQIEGREVKPPGFIALRWRGWSCLVEACEEANEQRGFEEAS